MNAKTSTKLWVLNLTVILLIGLDALDDFLIGTAMPSILEELGGIGWYGWTLGAFGLASFATIPLFAGLVSKWGLRKSVVLAILLFMLGSVGAALAPKMKLLVAARVIQGFGVGGLTAIPFAMISACYPKEFRSRPLGLISAVYVVTSLIGPPLASYFLKNFSWPWVFWFNLPAGLICLLLILSTLKEDPPASSPTGKLDLLGPFLFSIAIGFSLKALTTEWPWNLAQWGVALIAMAGFIWQERRHPNPVLPSDAWRLFTPLGAAFWAVIFIQAAYAAGRIYLPLLLEGIWGRSALAAGFILTLGSLTWDGGSFWAASAKRRSGFLQPGSVLLMIAMLIWILIWLWMQGTVWAIYFAWGLFGLGIGVSLSLLNLVALDVAENYPSGAAASTIQLGMTLGAAAGAAAANGIAQIGFARGFDSSQLSAGALQGTALYGLLSGATFSTGLAIAFAALGLMMTLKLRSR